MDCVASVCGGLLDGFPIADTLGHIMLLDLSPYGEHMAFLLGFLRISAWPDRASLP